MKYRIVNRESIALIRLGAGYNLEDSLGRKTRVTYLQNRKKSLRMSNLGDKAYDSPEYSPDFFKKEGVVVKVKYGPPIIKNRKSIKVQLGKVEGIFSTYMKLPVISRKINERPLNTSIFANSPDI